MKQESRHGSRPGASAISARSLVSRHAPIADRTEIKTELAALGYAADPYLREESRFGFFIRGQVPGTQAVHTASDIPISAYSTGRQGRPNHWYQQFYGVQTNTDVFFKLMRAALGGD